MKLRTTLLVFVALSMLCGLASATDLECIVTRGGALEDGVQVTLCPGGATEPTNAGMALFTNVAPGEYTLTAQKTIGTKLYGALEEGVSVLADSHVVVNVELTEAVYIPPCFPLALNNEWVYATWNKEAGGTATRGSRTEKVTGTEAVAGEKAQVIQFTESGGTSWSAYQASSRCGWAYYGDLIGAVTKLFDPLPAHSAHPAAEPAGSDEGPGQIERRQPRCRDGGAGHTRGLGDDHRAGREVRLCAAGHQAQNRTRGQLDEHVGRAERRRRPRV